MSGPALGGRFRNQVPPRTTGISRQAQAESARDKMEQLLALAYTDAVTNTVVFPAATSGGTGLAIGGSANPATPVAGYVDWMAYNGSLLGGGVTPPWTGTASTYGASRWCQPGSSRSAWSPSYARHWARKRPPSRRSSP